MANKKSQTYLALLRGVNVGGKNTIQMAKLRSTLSELGFANVATYIASGNVIVSSTKSAKQIQAEIEAALVQAFKLDSELIKVFVLNRAQLQAIIDHKPRSFGEQPATYHSDVIFLMDIAVTQALSVFNPREGVDKVWPGDGVIYSQRLSAERTRSRLNKVMSSPLYKSMTIRTWNTTVKLFAMLKSADSSRADIQ